MKYREQVEVINIITEIWEGDFKTKKEMLFFLYEQCPFLTELRDILLELSVCPDCCGDIQPTVIDQFSDEAWGRPILQDIVVGICEECGKEYDPNEE